MLVLFVTMWLRTTWNCIWDYGGDCGVFEWREGEVTVVDRGVVGFKSFKLLN